MYTVNGKNGELRIVTSTLTVSAREKQMIKITVKLINCRRKEWSSKEGLYYVLSMNKHYFYCEYIDVRKSVNFKPRCNLKAILDVIILLDSDSDSASSSDEEDMDLLLCKLSFKPKRILGSRINLEDLSTLECEQLFRLARVYTPCFCLDT